MRLFIFLFVFLATPTFAHDWFSELVDPISDAPCCSGPQSINPDCKVIPSELLENGAITEMKDGFLVNLTVEQARFFNPQTYAPVREMVPMNRVQSAPQWGLCIYNNQVQCFMAPNNV